MCDSFVTAAFGSTVDWKSLGFIDSRVHPTDVVIQGINLVRECRRILLMVRENGVYCPSCVTVLVEKNENTFNACYNTKVMMERSRCRGAGAD